MARALVLAALAWNAVLLILAATGGEAGDALYVLAVGAPPMLLLALGKHPRTFRALAGTLGLLYVAWSVATSFVGGIIFAPAGLLLVLAALCPTRRADARTHAGPGGSRSISTRDHTPT